MKKKLLIVFIVIALIALGTGVGLFIKQKSDEHKRREELKASIVNDYETFKVKIENFSEQRQVISELLNGIKYSTDLNGKYKEITEDYKKYEQILTEIETASTDLKVNCLENEFTEVEIKNKVDAFIILYEQAYNYYIRDVDAFNQKIKDYNDWVKNTQVTSQYKALAEYEPAHTEFVDLNGDGKFVGKEDNNS